MRHGVRTGASSCGAALFAAFCLAFGGPPWQYPAAAAAPKEVLCELSVVTDPPQAIVTMDGRKEETITPGAILLKPGKHLLVIAKAGYIETRRSVNIEPGRAKILLELRLERICGLVVIRSSPPGADITIDDAQRGRTPLLVTDLPPGKYRVRAALQGYQPVDKALEIADRTPQKLDISLQSDSGIVDCTSVPPGADVSVNGAVRGKTPCRIAGLPPGKGVVKIILDGYKPHEEALQVQAGDELKVSAILTPLPATLAVNSIPDGAIVYVNNERRGKTPLTLEGLIPGEYRIRTELPAHDPLARTVELARGQKVSEEFRLDRIAGSLEVITTPPQVKVLIDNFEKGVTAAEPDKPDAPSLPLLIPDIEPGSHSVVLMRRGYEKVVSAVEIQKNTKASLTQELKKLFLPDTVLRTGSGPDDVHVGVLTERFANGDIRLELKPGIFRLFKKASIVSEKPISVDAPSSEPTNSPPKGAAETP